LVTRSTCGSSAFGGIFAAAAADVTLRRLGAEDLALLFLGPVLSMCGAFSMEGVDMVLGSFWIAAPELTLARPKAPQIAGRALGQLWLGQPMTTPMRTMRRKSSRFCALKSARTSSANLAGITTGAPSPDIDFRPRTHRFARDAISLASFVG
jgi:hypothetical protein